MLKKIISALVIIYVATLQFLLLFVVAQLLLSLVFWEWYVFSTGTWNMIIFYSILMGVGIYLSSEDRSIFD